MKYIKDTEIEYYISNRKAKNPGYQSKKKNKGRIRLSVSEIWKESFDYANNNCDLRIIKNYEDFENFAFTLFIEAIDYYTILERYCLERCFQKIRIKGGMCNDCCTRKITNETMKHIYDNKKR